MLSELDQLPVQLQIIKIAEKCFAFFKAQWLHFTCEVDKCVTF